MSLFGANEFASERLQVEIVARRTFENDRNRAGTLAKSVVVGISWIRHERVRGSALHGYTVLGEMRFLAVVVGAVIDIISGTLEGGAQLHWLDLRVRAEMVLVTVEGVGEEAL